MKKEQFSRFYSLQTRWYDEDMLGHINHGTAVAYFEDARVRHAHDIGLFPYENDKNRQEIRKKCDEMIESLVSNRFIACAQIISGAKEIDVSIKTLSERENEIHTAAKSAGLDLGVRNFDILLVTAHC